MALWRKAVLAAAVMIGFGVAPFGGRAEASERVAISSRLAAEDLLIASAQAGSRLVSVGAHGHILLSDDGGAVWRQARHVPTRVLLTSVSFADAQRGWAAGHDAVILYTEDGGETWVRQFEAAADEQPILSVLFDTPEDGIAVGAFSLVLETRDGGRTWAQRNLAEDLQDDFHLNAVFPGPDGARFIAAEFGVVYRSSAPGAPFEALTTGYEGSFWGGLTTQDGAILVYGMRGNVWRSADGGESWAAVDSDTRQSLTGAHQLADGSIVMVGLGGVVLHSRDDGRSFTAMVRESREAFTAVLPGAGNALVLFGEAGVQSISRP